MTSAQPHVVFLVVQATDEHLLRLGLWAVTAASVGESVDVLLCAPALRRLADGSFDTLLEGSAGGAAALGLPSPSELLTSARALGPFRLLGCDTELLLAGVEAGALADRLDGVVSLPTFWRDNRQARLITL